ncbi:hypothetical protein [Flagellimonas allohymeniacidonis]|uniref:Toxin-antitoxin system YwqK family antitoxin n=1 Tax=Flagellimonas allohymeniacidonis TaxID=2517819 RepID=A0A4Q8QEL9_9FLAO|nr:hypothetical protein [Allomuricauda hymeniacidonis]TAI46953.1 hypothetical protein EW142_09645 [Allomuricauda hymeniacidonis]
MSINYIAALLFSLFSILCSFGQDNLDIKEIYIDNGLVYKVSNNTRFTGVAQKVRKNGHVVFEDFYNDGVILHSINYFNSRNKEPAAKTIYHKNFVPKQTVKYLSNEKGAWQELTHYDENGLKILEETKRDGIITYSCEFLNGKKHGKEYCFEEDGTKLTFYYRRGKKIKQ